MKLLINTLVILGLLQPHSAVASNDPMSSAEKAVLVTMQRAKADALLLTQEDFQWALANALAAQGNVPQIKELSETLLALNTSIEDRLLKVISLDTSDLASVDQDIKSLFNEFIVAKRELARASFLPAEARRDMDNVVLAMKNSIAGFKQVCSMGRSANSLNYFKDLPYIPNLPDSQFSVEISMGYGEGSSSNFSYQNSNSTSEGENRQKVGGVLYSTAGVSTSIALSGAAGSTVALAAAVAPYAIAIAVAFAIYSDFASAEEQAKLQNKIAEAKLYQSEHTASDFDVSRFYREQCQQYSDDLTIVESALTGLEVSSNREAFIDSKRSALRVGSPNFEGEYGTMQAAKSRLAQAQKDNVSYPEMDKDIALIEGFWKTHTRQQALLFTTIKMLETLNATYTELATVGTEIAWDRLENLQQSALKKLLIAMNLIRGAKNKGLLSPKSPMMVELAAADRFEELRGQYLKALGLIVQNIFGRVSQGVLKAEIQKLHKEVETFAKSHIKISEVKDLLSQVQRLKDNY